MMTDVSLKRLGEALYPPPKPHDSTVYGTVAAVNADSYSVTLNSSATPTRCAKLCDASVGDRVLVIIQANGHCAAIGKVGGSNHIEPLWTNPAPSQSFAQTKLSFAGAYDAYLITSRAATDYGTTSSSFIPSTGSNALGAPHYAAGENYRMAYVTGSSIEFGPGHPDDSRVIPMYVWGVNY